MELNPEYKKPEKQDKGAPEILEIVIKNKKTGEELFKELALPKHFSSGSVGYYAGGKMTNSESGERYQVGCNMTLIGSKPK